MSQQFHWESVRSLIPTTPGTAMQIILSQYTLTMLNSVIPENYFLVLIPDCYAIKPRLSPSRQIKPM